VLLQSLRLGRTHARLPLWGVVEDRLKKVLAQIWDDIRADPDQDKAGLISRYIGPLAQQLEATLTGGTAARK
jgi:hypothetical protein